MSTRTLTRLLATAGGLLALWLLITRVPWGSAGNDPVDSGDWSTFFSRLNRVTVTAVDMNGPDGPKRLEREGAQWTIDGLPTDSGTVARFWESVEGASVTALVARNPDNHARLGLVGDSVISVTFELDDETRALLVGDQGPSPNSSFVRRPNRDDSYLLNTNLRTHLTRPIPDWRDRRVVIVDTARVSRVEIRAAGDAYALSRADSTWTLPGGADAEPSVVQGLLEELATLRANGLVQEGDPLLEAPETASIIALADPADTLAVVALGGENGNRWVTARGVDVVFRLPAFRADRVAPSREALEGN